MFGIFEDLACLGSRFRDALNEAAHARNPHVCCLPCIIAVGSQRVFPFYLKNIYTGLWEFGARVHL